ncbi:hypothetical protein ACFYT7_32725 [Streptomyces sp. NPDC004041]|uniref:hypothetical protein n=1 Tax=Streptomyces TaxID=1883 RepID=UPI0033F645BC
MTESNDASLTEVTASGRRSIAAGGDVILAVTGDRNVVNQFLIFGGGESAASGSAEGRASIPAVIPVLIGHLSWVGDSVSVHPGRRLVKAYVEQALQAIDAPDLVAYGEEQGNGDALLLFTGGLDLCEVGATLLDMLDRMMAEDWSSAARMPGYLLPQLRLILHSGFGEYDGSRLSSPYLAQTLRAHARTTALQDAYAGDAVGVVALVTSEAYDARIYNRLTGSGQRWLAFSQEVADAPPLRFWSRGALSSTTHQQE